MRATIMTRNGPPRRPGHYDPTVREATFSIGGADGFPFAVDRQGAVRAVPQADGTCLVVGGHR